MGSQIDVRLWTLLLACIAGCARAPAGAEDPAAWRVEFEAADGTRAFALEQAGDAVRLEDGTGELLVSLRLRADGVGIEDAQGQEIVATRSAPKIEQALHDALEKFKQQVRHMRSRRKDHRESRGRGESPPREVDRDN